MKLTCTQENLSKAVGVVSRSVGKDANLPILSHILLSTEGGRLKLSATNLEMGTTCFVGARVEQEGSIAIPARLLMDYVSTLPGERVSLELTGETLHFSCDKHTADMKGMAASEFPLIPEGTGDPFVTLSADVLREAIGQVAFAAAKDESRPEIAGVFLSLAEDGAVRLAATDSYRLAERVLASKELVSTGTIVSAIVPGRAMTELQRVIGSGSYTVALLLENGQLVCRFEDPDLTGGSVEFVSRTVEGRYPDYTQIIPDADASTTTVTLEQGSFSSALKATSLFSRVDASDVKLTFLQEEQSVQLSAESGQVGKNDSLVSADVDGENQSIVFNHRYLLDGLSACGTDKVRLFCTSDAAPGMMRPHELTSEGTPKSSGYTYVIMPIKN